MVRGSLGQWDIMEYKFRRGIKILKFDLFLLLAFLFLNHVVYYHLLMNSFEES